MSANWDNIRQAVYVLGVGILGAAAAVGIIEHGVQEQLTEALTQILGAVALIIAAGNVHKGKDEPAKVPDLTAVVNPLEVVAAERARTYVGNHRAE